MDIFHITEPSATRVPIIISSPHSGTYFPEAIKEQFKPGITDAPDDTDWFIDRLYGFAPGMGILLIKANYSRWVIDLNRDPDSKPLYNDGRVITALTPETDFNGNRLYRGDGPDEREIAKRIEDYYLPYHKKLNDLVQHYRKEFGRVLLFDAHSIREMVPGIRKEAFPKLILGDNDETSCSRELIDVALGTLKGGNYEVSHNHPFKGGYITRSIGNPAKNIHALQLEMCKTNYMDDSETIYHEERAAGIQTLLKMVFRNLITQMK